MNLDKGGSIGRAIQEYAEFQLWMSDQEQNKNCLRNQPKGELRILPKQKKD
ncbi:hypothetical protein D6_0154 [Aeromonas phage D6]|uniref:Uncharacterized protein n=1 Tax=Aeromonas phage D6 TaxID=2593322 RepID=A0A514TWD1_9CAUD|nr:hypothetical protein PQC08_gp121 [Aeromonas phage D6]QDJ97314.1 hypothetical protein D6_0154 [Aeromonas phage D6]